MYLSSCLAGRIKRKQNNPKHQLRCFCCRFTSSHKLASDDIDLYKSIRLHYRPHSHVFKPSCLGSCGLLGLALLIRWPSRCIALQPCSSCLSCSSRGHWPCSWLVGADECAIWQWFLLKLPFACLWTLHDSKLGGVHFNLRKWTKFVSTYICIQLRKQSSCHLW